MKIYTTFFDNLQNLPKHITPISICLKSPAEWCGLHYGKLAPKASFFYQWRKDRNNDAYVKQYHAEVLRELDAKDVIDELKSLSKYAEEIALVCYEAPGEFCHRHLVAEWLTKNGHKVCEYEEEPTHA